jgi:hypothetical protein
VDRIPFRRRDDGALDGCARAKMKGGPRHKKQAAGLRPGRLARQKPRDLRRHSLCAEKLYPTLSD